MNKNRPNSVTWSPIDPARESSPNGNYKQVHIASEISTEHWLGPLRTIIRGALALTAGASPAVDKQQTKEFTEEASAALAAIFTDDFLHSVQLRARLQSLNELIFSLADRDGPDGEDRVCSQCPGTRLHHHLVAKVEATKDRLYRNVYELKWPVDFRSACPGCKSQYVHYRFQRRRNLYPCVRSKMRIKVVLKQHRHYFTIPRAVPAGRLSMPVPNLRPAPIRKPVPTSDDQLLARNDPVKIAPRLPGGPASNLGPQQQHYQHHQHQYLYSYHHQHPTQNQNPPQQQSECHLRPSNGKQMIVVHPPAGLAESQVASIGGESHVGPALSPKQRLSRKEIGIVLPAAASPLPSAAGPPKSPDSVIEPDSGSLFDSLTSIYSLLGKNRHMNTAN